MKKISIVLIAIIALTSCHPSSNVNVRNYGGSAELTLDKGQKLINASWKDNDLWVLTTDMRDSDTPHIYHYTEHSTYGIWNGSYTIKEEK